MRLVHGSAASLLVALGVLLAVAAGVSFVMWQAPVVQADIVAGD